MKKNYKSVKLSSKWTKIGYYGAIGGLVISLLSSVSFVYALVLDFRINLLIALALFIALAWFCWFLMKHLATGHIQDNIFYLTKFNHAEEKYTLDQLEKVKVYENRKEKYILATFDNGKGPVKYLFTNSKLFYAGEIRNTETVLKEILNNNKN